RVALGAVGPVREKWRLCYRSKSRSRWRAEPPIRHGCRSGIGRGKIVSDPAADEHDPDPYKVIGTVVAKHRILRLIGEGGMGKVYEGEHVLLGDRRALKFCELH